jgi:hypothetical protein
VAILNSTRQSGPLTLITFSTVAEAAHGKRRYTAEAHAKRAFGGSQKAFNLTGPTQRRVYTEFGLEHELSGRVLKVLARCPLHFTCLNSAMLCFSPASSSSTDEEDTDDDLPFDRGRAHSQNRLKNGPSDTLKQTGVRTRRPASRQNDAANSGDSGGSSAARRNGRGKFTRSRSPAVVRPSLKATPKSQLRPLSPAVSRHRPTSIIRHVLPATLKLHAQIRRTTWTLCIDTRKAGECLLLLGSLSFTAVKLSGCCTDMTTANFWILIGILCSPCFDAH